jgi:hypothetical protein
MSGTSSRIQKQTSSSPPSGKGTGRRHPASTKLGGSQKKKQKTKVPQAFPTKVILFTQRLASEVALDAAHNITQREHPFPHELPAIAAAVADVNSRAHFEDLPPSPTTLQEIDDCLNGYENNALDLILCNVYNIPPTLQVCGIQLHNAERLNSPFYVVSTGVSMVEDPMHEQTFLHMFVIRRFPIPGEQFTWVVLDSFAPEGERRFTPYTVPEDRLGSFLFDTHKENGTRVVCSHLYRRFSFVDQEEITIVHYPLFSNWQTEPAIAETQDGINQSHEVQFREIRRETPGYSMQTGAKSIYAISELGSFYETEW